MIQRLIPIDLWRMHMMRQIWQILILLGLSLLTACGAPPPDEARIDAFAAAMATRDRAVFAQTLEEGARDLDTTAVSAFYTRADDTVLTAYVGEAVGPDALFQCASMSKAVAAAGILTLAKQAGIGMDDDIRSYVTSLDWDAMKAGEKPVTLRGLLSHTAGATVSGFPGYASAEDLPTSADIVMGAGRTNTRAVRFSGEQGTFRYSGGGYQVAQVFAEELSGQPFAVLMHELVLGPLGMTRSTFAQPIDEEAIRPRTVAGADSGFLPVFGALWPMRGTYHHYPEQAAAGLWTTAQDYARFARAVMAAARDETPFGLDREVAQAMLTPVDNNYGLGLAMSTDDDGDVLSFGHSGANAGYRSRFRVYPETQHLIVVLTNAPGGLTLAREVIDAADRLETTSNAP